MNNTAEQKNQVDLIGKILKTHTFLTKYGQSHSFTSGKIQSLYERLAASFNVVEHYNEFKDCFNKDEFDSLADEEKLFVLREIEKEPKILPVMALNYKVGGDRLSVNIRVGLFQLENPDNPKSHLLAFGHRFESPSPEDGNHNFFHSQHITTFKRHIPRLKLPGCPEWITETQPSFPLDAKCPVTLVLAFLITLYGINCTKVILDEQNLRGKCQKKFEGLHYRPSNN